MHTQLTIQEHPRTLQEIIDLPYAQALEALSEIEAAALNALFRDRVRSALKVLKNHGPFSAECLEVKHGVASWIAHAGRQEVELSSDVEVTRVWIEYRHGDMVAVLVGDEWTLED